MPNDDSLSHELYKTLTEISERMGRLEGDVSEKVAVLLSRYREDVHRTTMGIHARLLSYEDNLERDRLARADRQKELDAKLRAIQHNQQLWIRTVVALALISIGIVIAYWWL